MKRDWFFLVVIISLIITSSCDSGDDLSPLSNREIIFGHFYGECQGEACIEIFKLNDFELLEDTSDHYLFEDVFQSGNYYKHEDRYFDIARPLLDIIPSELYTEKPGVYGCPDCGDWGGIHIQIEVDGRIKNFRFDQIIDQNPKYIRNFLQEINLVIREISEW